MDVSAFSSDNFDTKAWINDILKQAEINGKDQESNYTMSLVMKLQLYVQQVNNALEETSQQVLGAMPKISRDMHNLQQEALLLKDKMAAVRLEIMDIERDTGKSINSIEKLDKIKSQLDLSKRGLHESDNWTILVNDLEEVFDSKNIEAISVKILGMQNSLKLLVNVADYEDRKLQLEGSKNRLEAIASPAIVQAFSSNNTEQSMFFVKIFASIDRLSQLTKYYHKCQKDLLLQKWRSQLEGEQTDDSAVQWLHNYFDHLLSNWHSQHKWYMQIFIAPQQQQQQKDESVNIFVDIYTDVLSSLNPTINECIDAALKQTTDKLGLLQDIKQVTQQFAQNLLIVGDKSKIANLIKAIYKPLMKYTNKYYAIYEQAYLINQLKNLNCMRTSDDISDTIQALSLANPTVVDLIKDAQRRCASITENCGFCGFLNALREFLLAYADFYRVVLRQINRQKKKTEDWPTFQLCLSLLQSTGEVLLNLQSVEKELLVSIMEGSQKKAAVLDVPYKDLLLDGSELKDYESLIKCVTDGTQLALLDHVTQEFARLCQDIHHTTYQVVYGPISQHLDVVQNPATWDQFNSSSLHNSDLPDYSFSPQEYITQIGQYLLTLPQHLEPFLYSDNPALTCALKAVDQEYNDVQDVEGALTDVFLKIVVRGTCQGFCDKILSICQLSHPASRQLAHDINYLNNVLEDLGLVLSDNLQQLSQLLKIPAEQYQMQSSGCYARYVAAVRQMRNIPSN